MCFELAAEYYMLRVAQLSISGVGFPWLCRGFLLRASLENLNKAPADCALGCEQQSSSLWISKKPQLEEEMLPKAWSSPSPHALLCPNSSTSLWQLTSEAMLGTNLLGIEDPARVSGCFWLEPSLVTSAGSSMKHSGLGKPKADPTWLNVTKGDDIFSPGSHCECIRRWPEGLFWVISLLCCAEAASWEVWFLPRHLLSFASVSPSVK